MRRVARSTGMTPAPEPDAELIALRAEVAHLRRVNAELLGTVAELRATIERQQTHIDKLVRTAFGRKSERVVTGPTLFDDVPDFDQPPSPSDTPVEPVPPPEPATTKRRGHGRRPRPADLPRERVEIDLTDAEKACPCCHKTRVRIGADVSERLDYRPASLFVRQIVRPTYVCRVCERAGDDPQAVQRQLPPEPIPRGTAAAGLLAHLIVSKYVDHLPLYRQESILGRLGWDVTRSTLCDQILASAGVLEPLYRLMCDRVRLSAALHTDDTPVPLLAPRRTAHAWVYVGDAANPYTVFDLSVGRSRDAPTAFLKGYTGFVHADGYAGYNPVYEAGARHVGCWAHARRYFFDARLSDPERSHEALARIRALFSVEREAKEKKLTGHALAAYRQHHAGPVLAAFATWLADQRPRVLPKSAIGEAVTYASNQWYTLGVYLTDGRLTIDNAAAEQAIRPLCVGRRNWLHVGADGGLQPSAVLLSIAASVKRHGLNPWAYLTHVLSAMPTRTAESGLTDLLPDSRAQALGGPRQRAS
jgi:transposase